MAHQQYLYLKLLLRNNLLFDLDEYDLSGTVQHLGGGTVWQGLVCSFMGVHLASAFQPVLRTDGKVAGRDAGADLLQGYYLGRPESWAISRGPLCRNERVTA